MDVDGLLGTVKPYIWWTLLVIVILATILWKQLDDAGAQGFIPLIPFAVAGWWIIVRGGIRLFNWLDWRKQIGEERKNAHVADLDKEFQDLLNGKYGKYDH